jgi:hypothetical protein
MTTIEQLEAALKSLRNAEEMGLRLLFGIDLEAIRDTLTQAIAIKKYEEQTKQIPIGAEDKSKGSSIYNWRTSFIRDIEAMIAAQEEK